MKDKSKHERIAEQVNAARDHVIEHAMIAFIEEIDGRVASDDEIRANLIPVKFSKTPLTTFFKDEFCFNSFMVWRREHAVALEFQDSNDPIALSIVRVPNDAWPQALRLYVDQYPHTTTGTA